MMGNTRTLLGEPGAEMTLDEKQQQLIRDEEYFRQEVRRGLAENNEPASRSGTIAGFFETKVGFWLLTTVLVGLAASGYRWVDSYLRREEIKQAEIADRTRLDTDTMLKLAPMFSSKNEVERGVAIVLLDRLAANNAIDTAAATQVKALFGNALVTGARSDATPQERAQAGSILAYADRARVAAIQRPDQKALESVPAVSTAIDNSLLPVRVYLQIARKEDRPMAETAQAALQSAGLIVPGIELVAHSPSHDELRYCDDKTDKATADRVKAAVAEVSRSAQAVLLGPAICKKVPHNQFELWFGPGA